MLRKLATLRRQPLAVHRRLPAATAALAWVAFLLRVRGFARTQRQLSRSAERARGGTRRARDPASIEDWARAQALAVTLAARNMPGQPRCLTRSLALWWLLRRRAVAARMCVGVRPLDGEIEAHAWVVCGDTVINDHQDIGAIFLAFDGDIAAIADSIQSRSSPTGPTRRCVDPPGVIE